MSVRWRDYESVRKIGQNGSVMTLRLETKAHLTSRGDGDREAEKVELCVLEQGSLNFEERDGFER